MQLPEIDLTPVWADNPESEELETFVFLIVDVIGSSRLFHEDMSDDELLDNAAQLNAVYEHVLNCLKLRPESEWEWNWAGDGGVFAFPATKVYTDGRVFECAKKIADVVQLPLRMVIHRGQAYFPQAQRPAPQRSAEPRGQAPPAG